MPIDGNATPPDDPEARGIAQAAAAALLDRMPGQRDRLRAVMAVERADYLPNDDPVMDRWLSLCERAMADEVLGR